MRLLMLFIVVLYSSIGMLVPAANAIRPAMAIAIGAVVLTFMELGKTGTGFRIARPESAMLIALLAVCTISTFSAIWLAQGVQTTSEFARIVVIYVVIENVVTSQNRMRAILLTLSFAGLMPALGTIHHYLTGQVVENGRAAWVGVFGNPNEDAYALSVLVPIAAAVASRSRWMLRVVLWGVIAVYLLAIFLTFSRGGQLGLVVILAFLAWKQKSFVIKALMVFGLVGGVIVGSMFWNRQADFSNLSQDTTVDQRIATITAGFEMFKDHPVFGVGPGNSIVAYPLYVPKKLHCGCQDQLVIHNAFVQILSETGALGFISFMVLFGAAIFHAWKLQRIQSPDMRAYAMGLELALWGFVVCGLSGGFAWSWFPYIFVGLVTAGRHIAETATQQQAG
jgi:putative inorganic carbon (HCO3(-)) transporter